MFASNSLRVLALAIWLGIPIASILLAHLGQPLQSLEISQQHASDSENLRQDILQNWRNLKAAKFPSVVKLRYQKTVNDEREKIAFPYSLYIVKGNLIKVISSDKDIDLNSRQLSSDASAEINILNPSYYGSVISTKRKTFACNGLFGINQDHSMYEKSRKDVEFGITVAPPWSRLYMSITWPGIVESDGFTMLGWKEDDWNGERSVVIDFTYDPDRHGKPHQHGSTHSSHLGIQRGRVTLLADHYYVPVQWEVDLVEPKETQAKYRWNISMDYDLNSAQVPLFVARREQGSPLAEAKLPSQYSEREWTWDPSATIQDSEFTLSYYGLPEPDWYKPPRPWWFYTLIAGMALVVLGAVLYQLGKRWRGAAASKPGNQRRR